LVEIPGIREIEEKLIKRNWREVNQEKLERS